MLRIRGHIVGPFFIDLGAVAHLGERRLCKAEVGGSSPPSSTNFLSYYKGVTFIAERRGIILDAKKGWISGAYPALFIY